MSTAAVFTTDLLRRLDTNGPRYTSYPTADRFHEGYTSAHYQNALAARAALALLNAAPPLAIYVHLPFCESVCYYCACNKVVTRHHERAVEYLDALTTTKGRRSRNDPSAWWRHGTACLVISGPAAVVVASFATLAVAIAYPDLVLSTTGATPVVQARNHVSEGPKLAPLASPEGSSGRLGRPGADRTPQ